MNRHSCEKLVKRFYTSIAISLLLLTFPLESLCANDRAAESSIRGMKVIKEDSKAIVIEVEYYYDGAYGDPVYLGAEVIDNTKVKSAYRPHTATKGSHKEQLEILRHPNIPTRYQTNFIRVFMYVAGKAPLASRRYDHLHVWKEEPLPAQTPGLSSQAYLEYLLEHAIELIDSIDYLGDERLTLAKRDLESILQRDPKYVRAYIELARVHMKNDSESSGHVNSNGVSQAERLLGIAREIDPNFADTYVLFGYVYGVQKRYPEAIAALQKAQSIGTDNMWLYFNWGLVLQKQGMNDAAIQKYEEAINQPVHLSDKRLKSHNRAIPLIYDELLSLLEKNKNWAEEDRVYKKQLQVFGNACDKVAYGRFKLQKAGKYDDAIRLAGMALNSESGCEEQARQVLALAYLTKWNDSTNKLSSEDRRQLFYRSQTMYAEMSMIITSLAQSAYTAPVILGLKKSGIGIDTSDARGMNALAHAVQLGEKETVAQLLQYGANPNYVLNEDGATVLMMASALGNKEMVQLLLKNGADRKRKTKSGQNAESIARYYGKEEIVRLLSELHRL